MRRSNTTTIVNRRVFALFYLLLFYPLQGVTAPPVLISVAESSKQLQAIEKQIDAEQWPEKLGESWQQIDDTRQMLRACREAAELEIATLQRDLAEFGEASSDEIKQLKAARTLLNKGLQKQLERKTSCKMEETRAGKLLERLDKRRAEELHQLRARRALSLMEALPQLLASEARPLSVQIDWDQLLPPAQRPYMGGALMLATIVSMLLGLFARHALAKHRTRGWGEDFTQRLLHSLVASSHALALPISLLVGWGVIWGLLGWQLGSWLPALTLLLVIATYTGLYFAFRTTLAPFPPAMELLGSEAGATLKRVGQRALNLSLVVSLILLLLALPLSLPISEPLMVTIRMGLLSLFLIQLGRLSASYSRMSSSQGLISVRMVVVGFSVLVWGTELLGYQGYTEYLLLGAFATVMLAGLAWLVSSLWADFLDGLDNGRLQWQQGLRQRLQLKAEQGVPGLVWLRLLGGAAIWLMVGWWLLLIWGVTETRRAELLGYLVDGFSVGTMELVPVRIAIALLFFTLLMALTGWFRRQMEYRWLVRARMDGGAKNALVTMTGYVGITIGILIALSMAGVDFGNLALIAGALSVGIGFGLQNIVSNFVSGLILLFERPIRKGDWIVVGSTEGYVKEISIRSTTLETFDRAEVIVPNSELLSTQVTNWMLNDHIGRVKVPVGVAYGSDVALVKQTLLAIAHAHPACINDGSVSVPKAMFLLFADSSLNFELRFFIKEVDQRLSVISDINTAIDAAFRREGIEIPFPQRVVHMVQPSPGRSGEGESSSVA